MFVTFFYAVVDPKTGEVEFGNAGHLAPLIRRADGSLDEWSDSIGLPLGIVPGVEYTAGRGKLAPGETMVILSDGPGDAVGEGDERFGDDRVRATISEGPGDPSGLVNTLLQATAEFTGNRPQADDQTLLAIAVAD
jgi:sigma-B regulation protein RsbU (phosphoserine phosphatase)